MKIKAQDKTQDGVARAPGPLGTTVHARLAWSDFQVVLEVARHKSVAKACEPLALSHVTLLRKLEAIETRLKARLFERVRGRYTLTDAGTVVVDAATGIEPLARTAEMQVLGQDMRPSGLVRVTAAGIVIDHLLAPVLSQFGTAFPEVIIELVTSREHTSLVRREADVAIRVSDQAPDWLVGRKLGLVDFGIYGLKRPGLKPQRRPLADWLPQRRWIGFERDARELKFDRWLSTQVPEASVVLRVDGFSQALTMVRAGLGIALLPTFLEHSCPELQALSDPIPALRTPLWLLTHQELRDTMRIQVLIRAFGPALTHALQGL